MKDILTEYKKIFGEPSKVVYFKNGRDSDINETFQQVLALDPGESFNEHLNESDLVIMLNDEYKNFNGNIQGTKIITNNQEVFNNYKEYQFIGNINYENNNVYFTQLRIIPEENQFYVLKKR